MVRLPRADEALQVPVRYLQSLPLGSRLYRVHKSKYKPEDGKVKFNETDKGNARFSPLRDAKRIVPTLYAGLTLDCALMESVFHDVSPRLGVTMHPDRLKRLVLTEIDVVAELHLIDLSSIGLRRFDLANQDLIDTLPMYYKVTQAWATALYTANPEAHGLYWTSRLDNRTQAVMVFGDRPGVDSALQPTGTVRDLLRGSGGPIIEILKLAERIGVDFAV